MTDGTHSDKQNVLYDDVDLDGDGLVGRIERLLATDPLVSDNPLIITAQAAGSSPNTTVFTVPVSYDAVATSAHIKANVDADTALFQWPERATDGSYLINWDTTFEPAGDRLVQPEIRLDGEYSESSVVKGAGPVKLASSLPNNSPPYAHPLIPGTPAWINATAEDRVASVLIPQTWQGGANSWQLFCSLIAGPYFRGLWIVGTSISDSYNAERADNQVLNAIEMSPDLGPMYFATFPRWTFV